MKHVLALLVSAVLVVSAEAELVTIGSLAIMLPAGYELQNSVQDDSTKRSVMIGPQRVDGSQPSFFINEIDVSQLPSERQARLPATPEDGFESYLGTMYQHFVGFEFSDPIS